MPVEGGCQSRPARLRRCRPVKQEPAGHATAWRKHWTPRTGALTGQGDDFGHHTFTVRGARGCAPVSCCWVSCLRMSVQLAGATGSAHFEGLVKEQVSDRSSPASVPAPRAGPPEGLPRDHGHAAAVVGTERELLDATLRFLDAGLRAGDLVALTCPPETVELLSRELGERAAALESEPRMSLLGARDPDAMTKCQRYLERAMASGSECLPVVA